jgi:hypothetical protein
MTFAEQLFRDLTRPRRLLEALAQGTALDTPPASWFATYTRSALNPYPAASSG